MYRFVASTVLLVFASLNPKAQELNFTVTINADRVQTSDRNVFNDMARAFARFLNVRKWTTDTYEDHEKIRGAIFLNITSMPSIGRFTANAQITVARPVYNSGYETVLLNFADRDWEFEYIESIPLEYNDNAYTTNITSILAYYAYIALGMDYDSFSELGGSVCFRKALVVVNNAQSSGTAGWQSLVSNRNRYALIENLTNPQMVDLRKNNYRYHRLALDTFEKNEVQSRQVVLQVLKEIKTVWSLYPSSIAIISFFDAKSNELVNLFSKGTQSVRQQAYELLTVVDPKRDIYEKLIAN